MLNVRLDPKLEAKVRRIARVRKLTRSQVIREAIDALPEKEPTAYDLMKDAIGIFHSGDGSLARNHKERYYESLRDEHKRKSAEFAEWRKKQERGGGRRSR